MRPVGDSNEVVASEIIDLMGMVTIAYIETANRTSDPKVGEPAALSTRIIQVRNSDFGGRAGILVDSVLLPFPSRPAEACLEEEIGTEYVGQVSRLAVLIADRHE